MLTRVISLVVISVHRISLGALRHHPTVNQDHEACHNNYETQRYQHKKQSLFTLASGASQPHPLRQNAQHKRRQKRQMEALHKWCVQRIYKGILYWQSS